MYNMIDVSEHQSEIDFSSLYDSVSYVHPRIAGRLGAGKDTVGVINNAGGE